MKECDERLDQEWDRGWDGHEKRQLRRLADLPFVEKLEWLEEAQELAEFIQQSRRKLQALSDS
ncbi:MAG: hypothetical protein HOP29_09945 [Phycisphaerales bacterium]|nr:hypothetical protein [Phycisphaerales bacterium]